MGQRIGEPLFASLWRLKMQTSQLIMTYWITIYYNGSLYIVLQSSAWGSESEEWEFVKMSAILSLDKLKMSSDAQVIAMHAHNILVFFYYDWKNLIWGNDKNNLKFSPVIRNNSDHFDVHLETYTCHQKCGQNILCWCWSKLPWKLSSILSVLGYNLGKWLGKWHQWMSPTMKIFMGYLLNTVAYIQVAVTLESLSKVPRKKYSLVVSAHMVFQGRKE